MRRRPERAAAHATLAPMPTRPAAARRDHADDAPLAGWCVVSLRPAGAHAPLLRGARRLGATGLALSGLRLAGRDDDATRRALDAALACPRLIATSPAAVRFADALRPLSDAAGAAWFAVGAGSARALARRGVPGARHPARMDAEGLLALPGLDAAAFARDPRVGVLGAPGGREVLLPALRARGAEPRMAEVYARAAPRRRPGDAAAVLALDPARSLLALSSAEALGHVLDGLPAAAADALRALPVLAASPRLADVARARGCARVAAVAASARPADLLAAAVAHATATAAATER